LFSSRFGDAIAIRLQIDEDVHPALLEAARRFGAGGAFVISGIGMLRDPELGFFAGPEGYMKKVFPGNHELLNLSGNISLRDGELMAHLHALLADEQFGVFGGHLFNAQVGMTLEVMLQVIGDPVRMYRKIEDSGLPGLIIE
jgi:uncharacterized protein